jgi:hypothetical protein
MFLEGIDNAAEGAPMSIVAAALLQRAVLAELRSLMTGCTTAGTAAEWWT